MRQQFSMSFRLQRQRGARPSHVGSVLAAFSIILVGAWFWAQRLETPRPPPQPTTETVVAALRPMHSASTSASPRHQSTAAQVMAQLPEMGPAAIPYTFVFQGQSMSGGAPCPNTHILIRLQEGDRMSVAHGMTDGTGSYSIPLTFDMTPKTSVDWTLEADRQEYKSLEMSGRHIAITGDTSIEIERSFNLALR